MDTEVEKSADVPVPLVESNAQNTDRQEHQPNSNADDNKDVAGQVNEETALPDNIQDKQSGIKIQKASDPTINRGSVLKATKSEEKAEQRVSQNLEEIREAKKERLKKAGIRFTVEEPIAPHKIHKAITSTDSDLQYTNDTAISTPARISSTLQLDDLEQFTVEDEGEEADNIRMHSNGSDSDDEDDDSEREREPAQEIDSLQAKTDFLDYFEIPSLSDISEDSEEIFILRKSASLVSQGSDVTDTGKFVDPLTGQSIESSSISSSSSTMDSKETQLEVESVGDGERIVSEFDELMEIKKVAVVNEEQEDIFVKFTKDYITTEAHADRDEELEAKNLKREALQLTLDFMYDLFNSVVNDVENTIKEMSFKNKFDKQKLIEALIKEKDNYIFEKDVNIFLNIRMSDYYRRLKNTRPFARLSNISLHREHKKYCDILARLDHFLKLTTETKTKNAFLMSSVLMDLTYIHNIVKQTEIHLENVMLAVIGNKSEHLRRVTEYEIKIMKEKRNEISDARLNLITRKHTLGRITDQIVKLERINDNICMEDFISIQNKVTALNKKIEERNIELKRLRLNYHSDLHMTQHNREKSYALNSKLKQYISKLQKKLDTQRVLRERLYKAKVDRARLRKQHSDLSFQGGLLSLPALMHDYDDTVDRVQTKRASVNELKETIVRLTQRISDLETRCL